MRQNKEPRKNQLNLRLSDDEYERVCRAAHRAKRTVAEWCRLRLLAAAPCVSEAPEIKQVG